VAWLDYPVDAKVPKKVRQKIYNCVGAYKASQRRPADFASSLKESGVAPHGAVHNSERYRRRGAQGPALKGALLQHELKQEFIDFRKTVSARIWPKQVLRMAISIKANIITRYELFGRTPPSMPHLDLSKKGKKWLRRWRRRHQISFKKCGRKYKVSKAKILRRSKTTWLNSWSVMLVYKLLFGEKRRKLGMLPYPYHSVRDQMGRMMNEAESKDAPTLAFAGDDGGTGALKTSHGQSRTRASLWTMVSDDPAEERGLEICFKLKTDRCLKDLCVPQGVPITLGNSKSGSYDLETTLLYLNRHIPKWTPERERIMDYRLIHLDDFAVHNMEQVRQFLWDRGYVKNKIGGGCTFAMCGCDTDLHSDLQAQYMEIDMEWAAAECKRRPWAVPFKTRQSFVDDWVVIWNRFPHAKRGKQSFYSNGIAARPPEGTKLPNGSWDVPLVGPDDYKIGGNDAKSLFFENNMPALRKRKLEAIYQDYEDGKIKEWKDVLNYVAEHSDFGNPPDNSIRT